MKPKVDSTLNIEQLYQDYLYNCQVKRLEEIRGRDEYQGWFGASSAGSCYKKQYYRTHGYEEKQPDAKATRNMRVGTLVHEDIARAAGEHMLGWEQFANRVLIEHEITIPKYKVIGHLDLAFISIDDYDVVTAEIHDIKTAHSFKWRKMFGILKNRSKNPSKNYEMQLGTYAIGLKGTEDGSGTYNEFDVQDVRLYLDWIKKDDGSFKEVQVNADKYMKKAHEYWQDLNEELEMVTSPDDMIPTQDIGVPYYDWECRYCGFLDICGSPLANKEKDNGHKKAKRRQRANIRSR